VAALEVFKSGIDQYPKSPNLWIGKGIALYLGGDSDEAVHALILAADLNPNAYRPYLFLADAANASQKESAAAAERLKRFAELYPQDPRAVFFYAMSLRRGSQGEGGQDGAADVEALLKKAIALDPKFPDAHLELGNCYAGKNEYPGAIEQYRQTIALDPESATAHYKLAQALSRTGRPEQAEQEFKVYERLHRQAGSAHENSQSKEEQLLNLRKDTSKP
jgi:tetratricopeptide (TPR) repeat protein